MHIGGWETQKLYREDSPESGSGFTRHFHPFKTLPPLQSHIRPQFAIFDAGLKLKKLQVHVTVLKQLVDETPGLVDVIDLYKAWTMDPPAGHDQDLSYKALPVNESLSSGDDFVDDERDGDYDDRTREGVSHSKKRRAPAQETALSGKRKRKVPSNRKQQLLSEMTLSRLNGRLGRAAWTGDRIREWSKWSKPLRKKIKL